MTLTRARTIQYIGILLSLGLIAVGYWYFAVRAGVKTNTGASQSQGTNDLSAGLRGYWKLDENTGTSAADSSTNAITALTLTNGPTWTTGQIGSGIDFDGTNDYATTADNDVLDFTDGEQFTVTGWFNRDTFTTADHIFAKQTNSFDTGYSMYIDTADQIYFIVYDGTDLYSLETATGLIASSGWHHFAAVWGDTTATLYIDGVETSTTPSGTIGNIGSLANTNPFRIGASSDGSQPFDGKIDEIRVYDRTLSTDEIGKLYRLTTPTGVDTSLKGYWSFNSEALSGTTAYDRSGAGNTGTLTNGPTVTEGRVGQSLSFDGTDDYVTLGTTFDFSTASFTLTSWVKPTSFADFGTIIAKRDTYSAGDMRFGFLLYSGTGEVTFDCGSGGQKIFGYSPSTNEWTHLALRVSASSTDLYVNGILLESLSGCTTYGTDATAAVRIGSVPDGPDRFTGAIDEVRGYNRILTTDEVKALYDTGAPDKTNTSAGQAAGTGNLNSGLAAYWKLDENTGASAADSSTNAITALTLTNGPTWTTGQIGSSIDFDGTNDYATTADNDVLDFTDGEQFTVTGWFNRDTFTTDDTIVAKSNGPLAAGYVVFVDDATDYLSFYVGDGTDYYGYVTSSNAITSSGWHSFTAVWGDSYMKLYLDGADVGVYNEGTIGNINSLANAQGLTLGAESDGQVPFDGKLDEIRVYDRVLSANEIVQLHRLTSPTGVDTSLKGYWSFNGQDTTSTTAYDRSGVGNDGTLTGGPPVVEGRVGQALSFDNVNDYVLAGSPAAVDNLETQGGGGMTASAWIYPVSGGTFGGVIVGKRSAPSPGGGDWAFTMHQDGDAIKFYKSHSTTSLEATTVAGSIALNRWQFVTVTWNGGSTRSSVTFYIDGVLVPTSTSGGSDGVGTKDSDASNVVSISSQFVQYDGLIDEVRLHNRILSAAEVKALYDISAPDKTNTSVSTPQGTGRLDSGLVGYWKLDETTGSSASDSASAGNTGTLTNMENGDWGTGHIGNGLTFDGANEYVTMGDIASMEGTTKITASVWMKQNGTTTEKHILDKSSCNGITGSWEIAVSNGEPSFGTIYSSGNYDFAVATGYNVSDNQWHLLTGTYDGVTISTYVDGVLAATETDTRTIQSDASPVVIGGHCNGGTNCSSAVCYWNGSIDEARVYNRALTADEVANLYRLTAPTGTDTSLKGYWSFNGQDMSGTTAYDRSGAGNDGTLTNGPAVTEGKIGQALSFDGSNDYITMGDINALDGVTAMTASAWVKTPSGMSAERHIVDKAACTGATDSGTFELWHALNDEGKPSFTFYKNGGSPNDYRATSSVEMDDDQWHLVTGTYDGAALKIYVDGVETGSTAVASVTSPSTSYAVQIGGNCNSNPFPWLGSIDEVRLYNRALSGSEIKALYSSGR